jgi:hypothetical protein
VNWAVRVFIDTTASYAAGPLGTRPQTHSPTFTGAELTARGERQAA